MTREEKEYVLRLEATVEDRVSELRHARAVLSELMTALPWNNDAETEEAMLAARLFLDGK